MFHRRLARWCAWAGLLTLPIAACGSTPGPPTTNNVAATSTTTTAGAADTPSTASSVVAETTTTTEAVRTIEVSFAGGQVAGGARREAVRLVEKIRLRVTSDVADEVHVHTYDVIGAVAPGQPVELEVTATIPGRHEVELEKKRKQLLTLEVR